MDLAIAVATAGCAGAAFLLTPVARRFEARGFLHVPLAALLGALAAAVGTSWPHTLALCAAALGSSLLIAVDIAVHRLPRLILFPTYAAVTPLLMLAAALAGRWDLLTRALLAALALGAFYLLLGVLAPTGIGFGDVLFAPLIGLVLGWFGWEQVAAGTIAAFVLAAFFAIVLMALRRAHASTRIAFGPWMAAGAIAGPLALAL